eukprot:661281-Prymnesium_polylepis.1
MAGLREAGVKISDAVLTAATTPDQRKDHETNVTAPRAAEIAAAQGGFERGANSRFPHVDRDVAARTFAPLFGGVR